MKRLKEETPEEVFKDYADYYSNYQECSVYEIFELAVEK